MSKVRDKLRALHAPRPTELPDGIEVRPLAADPETSRQDPTSPPAAEPAARPRPAPASEPPPTTPRRPRTDVPPTAQPAAPPAPRSRPDPRPRAGSSDPPHRNTFPRPGTTVVRRDALDRWRNRRDAPPESPATSRETVPSAAPKPPPHRPSSATELLGAGKAAWAAHDPEQAARHLEAALDLGLQARDWWSAARTLVDVYLALDRDEDARIVLEELVDQPTSDPFPFLALADALEAEDPDRAEDLRTRARKIAPWC